MDHSSTSLRDANGTTRETVANVTRPAFWAAFAFAFVLLLIVSATAIVRFVRHSTSASGFGPVDLFRSLGMPLIVAILAIGAYLNVKRTVSSVSEDPAILRAITFYGLMVLGFAFLTMDLIL